MLQWFTLAGPGRIANSDGIVDRYARISFTLLRTRPSIDFYMFFSPQFSTVTPQESRVTGPGLSPFSAHNRPLGKCTWAGSQPPLR